jgi:glycosyltransferase involved in cell wall biosynthesis
MKIAIVYSEYPIEAMFSWYHVGMELNKIPGFEVKVFSSDTRSNPDLVPLKLKRRVDLELNKFRFISKHPVTRYHLALYSPLYDFKPDVIHLINAQTYSSVKEVIEQLKCQLIVTFRGFDILIKPKTDPEWKQTLESIFKTAYQLHFVSNYIKTEAIKLGCPESKSITIHQGIDLNLFNPHGDKLSSDNTIHLVSICRLVWEKGLIYALEAVSNLIKKGHRIRYTIYGTGADQHQLSYHIHRLNLESVCELKGYLNRQEIPDALSHSDIFLAPSLSEAMGNALLEASAMKIPVVASNVGGIPEAILNQQTGLLIQPTDVRGIEEAIEKLMANKKLAGEMGEKGRQHVSDHFAEEQELNGWKQLYTRAFQAKISS